VSGPRTFVGPNAPREQAVRYLVRERLPVPAEYVRDLLDVLDAARVCAESGYPPRPDMEVSVYELAKAVAKFDGAQEEDKP
jgi:hypothetical protein